MKLIRYEKPELSAPLSRLDNCLRDPFMGRQWPRFFDWEQNLMGMDSFLPTHRIGADLFEDSDAYHVRLEIPGVKKKDLRVELDNAVLTVSYEKHKQSADNGESVENFSRSVSIPDGIHGEKISAKLEDGVLTVTLPKTESRKPRDIKVK